MGRALDCGGVAVVKAVLYAVLLALVWALPASGAAEPSRPVVQLRLNVVTGWVTDPAYPIVVNVVSTANASREEVLEPIQQLYPRFHVVDIVRMDVIGAAYMLP